MIPKEHQAEHVSGFIQAAMKSLMTEVEPTEEVVTAIVEEMHWQAVCYQHVLARRRVGALLTIDASRAGESMASVTRYVSRTKKISADLLVELRAAIDREVLA